MSEMSQSMKNTLRNHAQQCIQASPNDIPAAKQAFIRECRTIHGTTSDGLTDQQFVASGVEIFDHVKMEQGAKPGAGTGTRPAAT